MASTDEIIDIEIDDSQPSNMRRKKSNVWEHFIEVDMGGGCSRALCKQCRKSFAYGDGSKNAGTSNLRKHIAKGCQSTPYKPENASFPSKKHCRGSFIWVPSKHQDSSGQSGAGFEPESVLSSMRSLTPASNQSLAVTQAPVSPSKNQMISIKESRSCEANAVSIDKLGHSPSSELITSPVKENDMSDDGVNNSQGNALDIGNLSSCSTVKTEIIESLEEAQTVEKPVEATMNTSTSFSDQGGIEGFVFVDNFKIPKEYSVLYKKIYVEHGHMWTKKVISSDIVLEGFVTPLLQIISSMETKRVVDLTEELLDKWERVIQDAELVKFNVKWLREEFNQIKNHWRSSLVLDEEIESHEQVMDAMRVKYDGLCTRKCELETQLSEVKLQISQTAENILSDQEAILEKKVQKINFENKPVLRIVLT